MFFLFLLLWLHNNSLTNCHSSSLNCGFYITQIFSLQCITKYYIDLIVLCLSFELSVSLNNGVEHKDFSLTISFNPRLISIFQEVLYPKKEQHYPHSFSTTHIVIIVLVIITVIIIFITAVTIIIIIIINLLLYTSFSLLII